MPRRRRGCTGRPLSAASVWRVTSRWLPEKLEVRSASKRLTDTEVKAKRPRLLRAVDEQPWNRIQLKADVESRRADRRHVADTWSHRVAEIPEVQIPRLRPDVAVIEEGHHPELAGERDADLRRPLEHRQAADRKAESAQGTHFVPPPAADARRAAEEVALVERNVQIDVV